MFKFMYLITYKLNEYAKMKSLEGIKNFSKKQGDNF